MIFLQGFIKFDQGISEKCVGQTFDGRKKERKKNNNNKNNKKRSKHNISPKLRLGDIMKVCFCPQKRMSPTVPQTVVKGKKYI